MAQHAILRFEKHKGNPARPLEAHHERQKEPVSYTHLQIKTLNRKERTHRLCTRGAMLESCLPHPEAVTDEQVSAIFNALFGRSETKRLIDTVLAGTGHKEDAE